MLTWCTHRTDFPGGIIWWHDYDIATRRGNWSCLQQSVAVCLCVLHTSTHHSRSLSLIQFICLCPSTIDSCGHETISRPTSSHHAGRSYFVYRHVPILAPHRPCRVSVHLHAGPRTVVFFEGTEDEQGVTATIQPRGGTPAVQPTYCGC